MEVKNINLLSFCNCYFRVKIYPATSRYRENKKKSVTFSPPVGNWTLIRILRLRELGFVENIQ